MTTFLLSANTIHSYYSQLLSLPLCCALKSLCRFPLLVRAESLSRESPRVGEGEVFSLPQALLIDGTGGGGGGAEAAGAEVAGAAEAALLDYCP